MLGRRSSSPSSPSTSSGRAARYWPLWLFLVAVALGGVGVWCAQVMTSTALQTSLPGSPALPMLYSFDMAILALFISVPLTYIGLLVLMGDVAGSRSSTSSSSNQPTVLTTDTRAARSAECELTTRKAAQKRAASLSTWLHLQHVRGCVTWRVWLGGSIVSLAMYQSRSAVYNIWVQPSTWTFTVYVWMLVWPFDVLLTVLSCLWFFHALRRRHLGAILFAVTVMGDWFIGLKGIHFRYRTAGSSLPQPLLSADVSYTAITLIAGIIAAAICVIFVGLQFSRMQLSRSQLSMLAATMQANITRLQDKLKVSEDSNSVMKQQLSFICKAAAHTAINTPVHTHYAYCMAQATTLDSYQAMWEHLSTSVSRPAMSAAHPTSRVKFTPSASSESSPILQPRASPLVTSETAPYNRPPLRLPSITMTPTKSASVTPLPPLPTLRLRGSTTTDYTDRAVHDPTAEASRSTAASEQSAPPAASTVPVATVTTQPTFTRKRRSSISLTSSNGESASRSKRQPRNTRSYEEQLAALLDQSQYSPYDSSDTPPAILSPGGQNKASISMAANTASNGGLAALLVHPACVAVIKGELQAIHSVENLLFYLHAQRYRQLQSSKLRKLIATAMYDTFIREGAEQQININARQRDEIGFCVSKRGEDGCSASLFEEAQREVLLLMETNLLGTKAERQCVWLMAQMPISAMMGVPASDEAAD